MFRFHLWNFKKTSPTSSNALNVSVPNNAKPHAKPNISFKRCSIRHLAGVYSL